MATFFSAYFLLKVLVTSVVVVGVATLAKHYSLMAAILASLPLTSILAFVWMHAEGQDNARIAGLADEIFWLVIPSLVFFLAFPLFLRLQVSFYAALLLAACITATAYAVMLKTLAVWGKGA